MSVMTEEETAPRAGSVNEGSISVPNSDSLGQPSGFAAAWMLARREWTRFFRQRNRVISAVVQPLLFWLLFGTGLRGSFEGAGD